MARLEDLTPGANVKGLIPDQTAVVVAAAWHGSDVLELTYKDAQGRVDNALLYRDNEPALQVVTGSPAWSFDGDGALLRLVSEAKRIRLAYLFDPVLAVHTSLIEPLPHQITAVYEHMLPRQPLRFLLADDPGAGKTIMAGLLIKELLIRGDLRRCLVVAPGNLVEQWQDELGSKFGLPFEILYREMIEASRGGNPFNDHNLLITRLDHLARNDDLQEKLAQTEWDLIICDEAHKMSASFFSGEARFTKRYQLGQRLAGLCRHFLLMTATPHNGKEEDFQLFMALLDPDRFEGRFRDGVHASDTSDLMRRLVKESLLKFDGTPLFPERLAYSVEYALSDQEAALYARVTDYVVDEMNRADRLDGQRGNAVGFALTILQRRLASSPEAIYQSLRRRRERLERRLAEARLQQRGRSSALDLAGPWADLAPEDPAELEDAPDAEVEAAEERLLDEASAARTVAELEKEIDTLRRLEAQALRVRQSGVDRKWDELSRILQQGAPALEQGGRLRKLIIFTEHRDTLNYLTGKIRGLLGRTEAVINIHGGLGREERRQMEAAFKNDPQVLVLVATDAAGEGINLQRAHLMVNYDLPWNPNRLEQRFGRIHRIGQTEVCHLWNVVANETREGHVFQTLLRKLEREREALGGQVFDVLGRVFTETPLRQLLIEAIRYGDRPETRARLQQVMDEKLDRAHLQALIDERALAHDSMDTTRVQAIREEMERYQARRLQPHFIAAFFIEAFRLLGGTLRERERGRFELTHVPVQVRTRDRQTGHGAAPVLARYERVTFEKTLIHVPDAPGPAEFVCPGHPLLDAVIDLILERHGALLKRGAVLVDPDPASPGPRVLHYLEHAVQAARPGPDGARRVVSRRLQFVEVDPHGRIVGGGWAPYLDYRPATSDEHPQLAALRAQDWLKTSLEALVLGYAAEHLVPPHLREVRERREARVQKTAAAVKARLTAEISYWDNRANQLKDQELAGRPNARLNSGKARQRADELEVRLARRLAELEQERQLSAQPPVVVGGALVIPAWLLAPPDAEPDGDEATVEQKRAIDALAMAAVLASERRLGRNPLVMPPNHPGYDIESQVPGTGRLLFIEVKGKALGKPTVTISRNQIVTAQNVGDDFILAVVQIQAGAAHEPVYIRGPHLYQSFSRSVDFSITSVNFKLAELLARGGPPV